MDTFWISFISRYTSYMWHILSWTRNKLWTILPLIKITIVDTQMTYKWCMDVCCVDRKFSLWIKTTRLVKIIVWMELVDGMKNVDIVISMFIFGWLSCSYFTKQDITRSHLTNSRRSCLHGAIPRRPIHISLNPTSTVHTQPIHAPTNHTPPIYTNPIHTPPVYSSRVSTLHPSKLKLKFYRSGFWNPQRH